MSTTWRAILACRELLKKGLVKRIGDGASTRISDDRWLPGHFAGVPLTPTEGQVVENVADIITESGAWNQEFIRDNFFPVDACAILKHGLYSVKSAYRLQERSTCSYWTWARSIEFINRWSKETNMET